MTTAYLVAFAIGSGLIHFLLFSSFAGRASPLALVLPGAALSTLAYQLWVYFDVGFLEPFFLIAAAVQFGIALATGALVALMFRKSVKK